MGRKRTGSGVTWLPHGGRLRAQFKFTYLGTQRKEWLPFADSPANRKAADEYAAAIRMQIAEGTFRPQREFPNAPWAQEGEIPTVKTAFEKWLVLYEQGHVGAGKRKRKRKPAPRTVYEHRLSQRLWTQMLGADRLITEITYDVIENGIARWPWPRGEELFNHRLDTLRMVFKYWRRTYPQLPDLYEEQHEATQHHAKDTVKRVDPLLPEQREAVLADLFKHYDERLGLYFTFQFWTGMRPGETVALLWKAVQLSGRVPLVNIERTRSFRMDTREGKAKTVNSIRTVQLMPQAVRALEAMRKWTGLKDHGHVFENHETGRPWANSDKPSRYWNSALTRLKLAHRTAYCCRHTYATTMIMAKVAPKWIADQMGTSLLLLDKTYTKWLHEADEGRQIEQASEYLAKTGGAHVVRDA